MDQFTVDAGPDNVTSRAHYPLTEFGILTRVLWAITEYAHLSLEMTGIVRAIFPFRQPIRFAQTLAFLAVLRKLVLLCMLHLSCKNDVVRESCAHTCPSNVALHRFTKVRQLCL
jgi:hypothetical protein